MAIFHGRRSSGVARDLRTDGVHFGVDSLGIDRLRSGFLSIPNARFTSTELMVEYPLRVITFEGSVPSRPHGSRREQKVVRVREPGEPSLGARSKALGWPDR